MNKERTKIVKLITYVSPDQADAITEYAAYQETTISSLLRLAIKREIKRRPDCGVEWPDDK